MDAAIDAVRVAGTQDGAVGVVLLAPESGDDDHVLPIFVDFDQAMSIARGIEARDVGRPLTHDLMLDVIEELGGRVDRVVVDDVVDNTYIADFHLNTPRDDVVIDARPSDALALGARTDAPIAVDDEVFEDGRQPREEFDELQTVDEVIDLG